MIFDSYKVDFDELYKYADNNTLKRIKIQIEEWKEQEIQDEYFKSLSDSIYKRIRVKNCEILYLLIYGAYIEEQLKVQEKELQIMKEDVNYYYIEGQKEANKLKPPRKEVPITDTFFLDLLGMINAQGYIWSEYIRQLERYNSEQIYRQMSINLQQQRPNNINDNIYQNILKSQLNSKIRINKDKISGALDSQLIGMNNKAKVEGMLRIDKDARARFIAIEDNATTPMCHSLDGQIFKVNGLNEFNRYYGADNKDLTIRKIKCNGLVLGLNLPPIDHHFHWCRSTITYQVPVEKEDKTEYNEVEYVRKNKITDNRTLDDKIKRVKKLFPKYIQKYIEDTPVTQIGKGQNNHYYEGKLYLLNDATESEIIHEIGHIIEEKNNIAGDSKYQSILKNNIGLIDVFNNEIGSIEGYDSDKYEFLLSKGNFISDYQRRVYGQDINKVPRYNNVFDFNYNVFRDYFPEGLSYYFSDRQLLKNKNIDLYRYIEEVLNERK